ncbi:rCG53690 [Rattus norvegicus]|uniref:RCG53690 n=2 Tax=Rattus norvegicus TaxID=10116 RepID=A6JAN8_RAT|nr:rCG53690 [Rattus norvegicus]
MKHSHLLDFPSMTDWTCKLGAKQVLLAHGSQKKVPDSLEL